MALDAQQANHAPLMALKLNRREYLRKMFESLNNMAGQEDIKTQETRCCKLVETPRPPDAEQGNSTNAWARCRSAAYAMVQRPPMDASKPRKKTLVLDLDETLIHSSFENKGRHDITLEIYGDARRKRIYVNIRPFAREFIAATTRMFEVAIFTAATPDYANPVIDAIDCERRIGARLFRDMCTPCNGCFVKDLDLFNRDPKDIIIVDNSPMSYYLQPNNAIPISSWHESRADRELVQLLPFLRRLASAADVVPILTAKYPLNEANSDIARKFAQYGHVFPNLDD